MDPLPTFLPTSSTHAAKTPAGSRIADDAIDINEVPYLREALEREVAFRESKSSHHAQSDHGIVALDINRQGTQSHLGTCSWTDEETFINGLSSLAAETTRILLFDVGGSRLSQTWLERYGELTPNPVSGHSSVRRSQLSYGFFDPPSLIPMRHAKAYTFDLWDLQNLWTPSSHPNVRPFIMQNNVLESLLRVPSGLRTGRYMGANRQRLFLGQHTVPFWECISSIESCYGEDNRLLIKCEFATLPVNFVDRVAAHRPTPALNNSMKNISGGIRFSPLKHHFLKILKSESSATTISQVSPAFACQMVVLDLLRAVIECWIVFVTETLLQTLPYILEQDTRSRAYNTDALNSISKISRDIGLLSQASMDSALLALKDDDLTSRNKLRAIRVESNARLQRLQHRIDDLIVNFETVSAMKKTLVEEVQTQSIKRLTTLAAIFLPLGLASSLLSMQTRVIDLGILWYDYFGICFLLFFVGVNFYQFLRFHDLFYAVRATQTAALVDAVRRRTPRNAYRIIHSIITMSIDLRSSGSSWNVFQILLNNGFLLALVSSFCVGMFKSLNLAGKIAAYSAASWATLSLLLSFFLLCVNFYKIISPRARKTGS